jgi:NTP pyrophosphatase (non-canonical NTP hydrolase)
MDWLFALGEAILTVIIGVSVYVLGEVIIEFYIKPVNELSDTIGEVLDSLVFYANIYTNPARTGLTEEENKFSARS